MSVKAANSSINRNTENNKHRQYTHIVISLINFIFQRKKLYRRTAQGLRMKRGWLGKKHNGQMAQCARGTKGKTRAWEFAKSRWARKFLCTFISMFLPHNNPNKRSSIETKNGKRETNLRLRYIVETISFVFAYVHGVVLLLLLLLLVHCPTFDTFTQ